MLAERYRVDHNVARPHSSLGYRTPAEFAALCMQTEVLPREAGEASDFPIDGGQDITLS